ncbi:3-phosphoshikimate 1-carboxyvinyltransferase [Planctomycetes bacterium Pla163]|uniref:Multifunctional fusion protein n=1 Tax=Rohdeia mirabilis TaxID=2528008 RepID=A0A518CYR7_9BACT|nr:3-phosphoshikimate 1-carboxyvinyltransferase [Planctomycetes bacterium Pla163]
MKELDHDAVDLGSDDRERTTAVEPLVWAVDARVDLPGSKSEANRALVAAALSGHRVTVTGATACDDVQYLVAGLATLGYEATWLDRGRGVVRVGPRSATAPTSGELFCGNAGTALRFLVSVAAITPGRWVVTGDAHMLERPIGPLVEAWRSLGVDMSCADGRPPVRVASHDSLTTSSRVRLDPSISSQYVSSLLLVGSRFAAGLEIEFDAPCASEDYARLTCDVLEAFGVLAHVDEHGARVETAATHTARTVSFDVAGDWSAMGVWSCLNALSTSHVAGTNLTQNSGQADEALGLALERLRGPGHRELDVSAVPDQFMNLAVVAAARDGRTHFRGAANLRVKECDRLAVTARELRRLGVEVDEHADGLTVTGTRHLRPATIDPEGDHRVAMAFALAGSLAPGIHVADAECVAKSYPAFWSDLERVRASVRCVCVVGMRAAGKSSLARALADRTGLVWMDSDLEFERRHGSIARFVAERGWAAFRGLESEIVRELAAGPRRVVSLGGGALEDGDTLEFVAQNTLVVHLDTPLAIVRQRVAQSLGERPSVTGGDPLDELDDLARRRAPHFAAARHVVLEGDLSVPELVEHALVALGRDCRWPGGGLRTAADSRGPSC